MSVVLSDGGVVRRSAHRALLGSELEGEPHVAGVVGGNGGEAEGGVGEESGGGEGRGGVEEVDEGRFAADAGSAGDAVHVLYPPGAAVGWGVVEWREEGSSAVRAGEAAIASEESGREGAGVESGSAVTGGVGEVEVTAFVSFAVFVWKGVCG